MKTIKSLLLLAIISFAISCEGPMGPPGYDGIDGVDGETLLGSIFEIEGDFTPNNDYTLYYAFPDNFEIYDGDVVLVYILWEQAETNNGGLTDVWRLCPQTVVLNDGVLQYNFDYTLADVQIFLEGTTNFNNLLPAETDNQIFRIAVLPAAFAKENTIDVNNFNAVMKSLNLNLNLIEKINPTIQLN
jgi:hypothetical protein